MNLYADIILDLWRNPQNFGELNSADLEAYELNPLCGDEVKIQLKLDDKRLAISDTRFIGNGCAISTAATSLLTEFIKGKKLSELMKLNEKDVIFLLGIEVGPQRIKCAILPLITLKKALRNFYEKAQGKN